MKYISPLSLIGSLILLLLIQGCAGLDRLPAVPRDLTAEATVPGFEDARYRLPHDLEALTKEGIASYYREVDYAKQQGETLPLPPATFLAISGGGDNGAFGAGLLNGWTMSGSRPDFKLVTGVSTGALTAPFAFLGPEYDLKLKEFYTTASPERIFTPRSMLSALTSDAMADYTPLWDMLDKEVNEQFIEEVAREYHKGRLLLIATVDIDASQSVLWNMTKIAASGHPKALEMFRSIMIASASIPGAFPPILIDVEVDGKKYQEMHVDGGTAAQVFVYPPSLHIKNLEKEKHVNRGHEIFVVRNARLDPEWTEVERQTMSIAGKAVASLIQTQGIGDLYQIYSITQRDNIPFNLAYIPADFSYPHKEMFDTKYMNELFRFGEKSVQEEGFWKKNPPEF